MADYLGTNTVWPHDCEYGNVSQFVGQAVISAAIANTDTIRIAFVPAGTLVSRVSIRNPDLDSSTGLAAKIGFVGAEEALPSGADVAVAAAGAWAQSAAVTGYDVVPPYQVDRDAWLVVAITTGPSGTAGTGTVSGVVTGIARGPK